MEIERQQIVEKFATLTFKDVEKCLLQNTSKDELLASQARIIGNSEFYNKDSEYGSNEYVWSMYTSCIAYAPTNSEELALGYERRSDILFRTSKFEDAIVDIDRAILLGKNNMVKVKLMCRKIICLRQLGAFMVARKILQKAKILYSRCEDWLNKEAREVQDSISKLENALESDNSKQEVKIDKPARCQIKKALNDLSDVAVKRDEKYGNHLVATRDIGVGEVLFVQKPYFVSTTHCLRHSFYCSHCLKACLTTIPCKTCTWFMSCSIKCKNDAWNEYHSVECLAVKNDFDTDCKFRNALLMALNTTIIECNKRGGVANLKAYLQSFDSNNKNLSENMIKDGKLQIDELEVICNTSYEGKLDKLIDMTVEALFNIALRTKFFGKTFLVTDWESLIHDQDFIFIGSLILKLSNFGYRGLFDYKVNNLEKFQIYLSYKKYASSVCSLITHSCHPNVARNLRLDNNIIVYAVRPIKKNDQLFMSYINDYEGQMRNRRQSRLKEYNITCDCIVCRENWQPKDVIMFYCFLPESKIMGIDEGSLEMTLYNQHKALIKNLINQVRSFQYSESLIPDLAKSITLATVKLPQSSFLTRILIRTLNEVFLQLYCIDYQIPEKNSSYLNRY